jgi:transcriptional regulator with XRE-family HTH domain
MEELDAEARRGGPKALAEAEAFKSHFRLAAELIVLRKRRRLTQRQLSALSGIQQSEISRIESASGNPTLDTISVLARALGAELRLATATSRPRPATPRVPLRQAAGRLR